MSDSISVRVSLDSYDLVHPSEKQTQVYVQIPEVARASWLLDASFYAALKNEPWPHVIDSAHEEYERRGVVSDSASAAARKAIVDWLLLSEGADYDAHYDAMQAAWEADQARQHPVARKLLKENEQLRARVAELEAERHTTNEALDDAVQALRERQTEREALVERMRAGQRWQRGRKPELVSENHVSQSELREIFGIPLTPPWENEPAPKCRCDEPGADPYSCEADDCSGEFSELNPFGGGSGPVEGHDAKVSRTCGCGWQTSVWHVADGSAEEELHGHVVRVHGGVYPQPAATGGA